ncbi:MAG: hypothetical protein A3I11_01025 [Elusimicrobia bacterium RIFCSPLOWO2_02_FULL_39_32]|nr:MAG: hypothetical protein A2034_02370 [Elusimicrobia bacterium GWA2_38_7]OGR79021.1 MAG: hypothetical protein A3B80_08050 [Elusimicrobia bacterium RIFCSPHIGHO2_02_FULL_39_36]OGR92605.1 MAG: hypothetical protein A3I11_01025 [Elusimicrobia bacterium RIFCSPLOWO2_02_FULL_39_32]OGR99251.1 MAG: hypothetical protein A3G85_06235 [Elusimicrobia bacterium RIFCSPLOWO2_12_FULL_39_28]
MKCSIKGCPGTYKDKKITHTVRYHGEIVVIDHVPAEICSECGDVLLKPETIRHLEELLKTSRQPSTTVPLYEFA